MEIGSFHSLKPYDPVRAPQGVTISARASRTENGVQLEFELRADPERVLFPEFLGKFVRENGLWEHTCLEAFVAPGGPESDDSYWEINLSPSGSWNVYRFSDYRLGMSPEGAIPYLTPYWRKVSEGAFVLNCEIPLPVASVSKLDVGMTAVIEEVGGRKSYWALEHAGERPDFHLRESFILTL